MEPASAIIKLFGGAAKVAAIIGKHPTHVYRWTYTEGTTLEGTGGLVPAKAQLQLLAHARANEIDLRPEDFFSADRLHAVFAEREGEAA